MVRSAVDRDRAPPSRREVHAAQLHVRGAADRERRRIARGEKHAVPIRIRGERRVEERLSPRVQEIVRIVLEAHEEISRIWFEAPNKHHFLVDLEPFGLDNAGEVFIAADRPYGLIEATVMREDD